MRSRLIRSSWLPPIVILLASVGAVLAIATLNGRIGSSQRAQLAIVSLQARTIRDLEVAPQQLIPGGTSGPSQRNLAATVAREIRAGEATLAAGLTAAAHSGAPAPLVATGRAALAELRPAEAASYALGTTHGGLTSVPIATAEAVQTRLLASLAAVSSVLSRLARVDGDRGQRARTDAALGTAISMAILLLVLGYFYLRALRLGRENEVFLEESRREANTDAVTGLPNRRALTRDLSEAIAQWSVSTADELLVAIFDLNGFKTYNDTFGHADGDLLLTRLGRRLSGVLTGTGRAYRMGGDEFCIIATCAPDAAERLLDNAVTALSYRGEGWQIGCSHGAVWVPSEADTPGEALRTADTRMYANKSSRSSAGRQVADALLQVARERDEGQSANVGQVAELAGEVARALQRPEFEVQRIQLAATLRDIGKAALHELPLEEPPDARTHESESGGAREPELGDTRESGLADTHGSELLDRHTVVGERIVAAAPALADIAPLIRSSHERFDGRGGPDGLLGRQIPLGSRIIAACDAFCAITAPRPNGQVMPLASALEEMRRRAGSQFDPAVIHALCDVAAASQLARGEVAYAA
jgi:diguanylate cyclase (GGDEF)-like protein